MTSGEYLVIRSTKAWVRQAQDAFAVLTADNHDMLPPTLRDCANINRTAFSQVIKALIALAPLTRQIPDAELIELAGLRPVYEMLDE